MAQGQTSGAKAKKQERRPPAAATAATYCGRDAQEEALILEHLPLVRFMAARVAASIPSYVELDDLVQTGTLGLIEAIRRFDGSKGIPFSAYARFRVRGAMLDGLRSMDWATRTQRRQQKEASRIANSENPETAEVTCGFYSLGPVVSISSHDEDSGERYVAEPACSPDLHPDRECERSEAERLVEKAMQSLPSRYKTVVMLYYSGEHNMREIGRTLGVKESRVSQMHRVALDQMKRALCSDSLRMRMSVA